MTVFSSLEDALEEAKWCAESMRVKHIISLQDGWFRVAPKYSGKRPQYSNIEVGFSNNYRKWRRREDD